MSDHFQEMIDRHRARMKLLRETFDRQGYLFSVSDRDPSYSLLLTRNGSSDAAWRVTSFCGNEPVGHREYDKLEGGSPIQNAFQEFAGDDSRLVQRNSIRRAAVSTPTGP